MQMKSGAMEQTRVKGPFKVEEQRRMVGRIIGTLK